MRSVPKECVRRRRSRKKNASEKLIYEAAERSTYFGLYIIQHKCIGHSDGGHSRSP